MEGQSPASQCMYEIQITSLDWRGGGSGPKMNKLVQVLCWDSGGLHVGGEPGYGGEVGRVPREHF